MTHRNANRPAGSRPTAKVETSPRTAALPGANLPPSPMLDTEPHPKEPHVRPGVTVLTIPGTWYITTELTGPAERGSQPQGTWTGLAGADLGLNHGTPVDPADLAYLVGRFGAFDVIIAAGLRESAEHARILAATRHTREARDTGQHVDLSHGVQQAAAIWAAFDRRAQMMLTSMQRSGEPPVDDRVAPPHRPPPVSLGHEWIIASFRHDTDDETGDPLLHIHSIVPAVRIDQFGRSTAR
jgi:hypothetical protein